MARKVRARNRPPNQAPHEALAVRIFHLAVIDACRPGRWQRDAILFLSSPGAACMAESLGYCIEGYRRGVARLVEGQSENQATANGGAAQLRTQAD